MPKEMEAHYENNVIPLYRALIEAQKEYIDFLGRVVGDLSAFAYNHNIPPNYEDITKGEYLRKIIAEAELKLVN